MFHLKKYFQNQNRYSQSGITLLDIMIAMGIFSIIIGMSLPKLTELRLSYDRYYGRQILESTILKGKARTLEWGARGIMTFIDGGTRLSYGLDFLPYSETFVADDILFSNDLPETINMEVTNPLAATKIIFDSRGFIIDEDGEYISPRVDLMQGGKIYCIIELYTAGSLHFECD
jgi:hypothetical protein